MKILLVGGGTGGHIMPILAVVEKLKKLKLSNVDFLFIGPKSNFNNAIKNEGILVKTISAGKLRRYISIENLFDIAKIPISIIQSLFIIHKYRPDIIFSKGGYASVPPVVAGWFFRIPIITHESDTVPGLANKIISRFANKILISFPDSEKYFNHANTVCTGNPIREEILNGSKDNARKIFDLQESIPTILIFGGSQGAKKINESVLKMLSRILREAQIIHICGKNNFDEFTSDIKELNLENIHRYKLYPFLEDELKDAFALCDIAVSRAGANSISEIMILEKPSIIIPLTSSANNHQYENAEYYSQKGMAILLDEQNLSGDSLEAELKKLLQKVEFWDNMKKKIVDNNKNWGNAAMHIAKEIVNYN